MKKKIKVPELTDAQVSELRAKWENWYGGNWGSMRETTEFNFKFYLVIATVITVLVVAHELKYFP